MFEATEELRGRAAICGEATAYCMIDLENFTQINDIHGHATGDAVLVMLCERARALFPREARLARRGGDEFAFVIPYPAGHDDQVDELVEQAFADARERNDSLRLSINKLRDPWFAQRLLKKLAAANFPPQRLEIEITENCLHENTGPVRSMIMSLRNQRVQMSLDDLCTGYSSSEQLRDLPFDRIKIDRSLVSKLREPGGRSQIVEAIVALGRGRRTPRPAPHRHRHPADAVARRRLLTLSPPAPARGTGRASLACIEAQP